MQDKACSRVLGYEHGKADLAASQIGCFPVWVSWSDYNEGYALGLRDKRSDELMDDVLDGGWTDLPEDGPKNKSRVALE